MAAGCVRVCECMKLVRFTYTEGDLGGQLSGDLRLSQLTQPQAYTSKVANSLIPYLPHIPGADQEGPIRPHAALPQSLRTGFTCDCSQWHCPQETPQHTKRQQQAAQSSPPPNTHTMESLLLPRLLVWLQQESGLCPMFPTPLTAISQSMIFQ